MKKDFALVALLVVTPLIASCSKSAPTTPTSSATSGAAAPDANATSDSEPQDEQPSTADADPPVGFVDEVLALVREGKFDDARERLDAAEGQRVVDEYTLQLLLRPSLASALDRGGRSEEAFSQREKIVAKAMTLTAVDPKLEPQLSQQIDLLVGLADRLGGAEQAERALDAVEKAAQGVENNRDLLVAVVAGRRALLMANAGRVAEGRDLLARALDKIPAPAADAVDAGGAILLRAQLLLALTSVEAADPAGDPDAAWDRLLDELFAADAAHPDDEVIRGRLFNLALQRAGRLAMRDPERAGALLDRVAEIEEFNVGPVDAAALDDPAEAASKYTTPAKQNMFRMRLEVAEGLRRTALYGTPAELPLHADRWVNADEPPNRDQLKGKVVLLDFFAVWCGPCIATFPHLRDWQDKYADQGFQIIGVSEYHGYGWNEELGRSQRVAGITPETERDELVKFAKHHELPYPIALVPDDTLQQHYYVNGIPHAVLIDRAGKVRLFRIGSGEQNARDLEEAIETALAEE